MRNRLILTVLALSLLPTAAMAGGRDFDRGSRYRGGRSNSGFSFSLGFGGGSRFGGFGGFYRPTYYRAYDYYPPPTSYTRVYYPSYYYAPAPVYVAPAPPVTYYYAPPANTYYLAPPTVYSQTYYYYRR